MRFLKVSKPDNEILKVFIPCRKNFIFSSKTAIKQLKRLIKTSVVFCKVFVNDGSLGGCLFIDKIDEAKKVVEFGGFAKRHAPTKQAIKEFIAYIKYYYPTYKIKAVTKYLTAKICLTRAGLTNDKGDYIYD